MKILSTVAVSTCEEDGSDPRAAIEIDQSRTRFQIIFSCDPGIFDKGVC